MKNKFLAFAITIVFLIPLTIYSAPKDLTVKKIGGKKGSAPFSHTLHKKAGIKKCKECHHKGKTSDSCSKCHKGNKGKKAIHKNCIGCHKKMNKGPKKCKKCHMKK